jgi:transcriptional regulator with XRE-family HTH domain
MTKKSPAPKSPKAVDIHVGSRVRLGRTMSNVSQEKLGVSLGITFQQIQKYEKGTNRIGSSRLVEIATALDLPVSFFFEGLQEDKDGKKVVDPEFIQVVQSPAGSRLIKIFCEADVDQQDLIASLASTVVRKGKAEATQ